MAVEQARQRLVVTCSCVRYKAMSPFLMLDKTSSRNFSQQFSSLKAKTEISWEIHWLDLGIHGFRGVYGCGLCLTMVVDLQNWGAFPSAQSWCYKVQDCVWKWFVNPEALPISSFFLLLQQRLFIPSASRTCLLGLSSPDEGHD